MTASGPIASRLPGGEVGVGDVQVDVELVAGQGALVVGVGQQADHPGTHHVDLRLEVPTVRDRAGPRPGEPVVAEEPELFVEDALVEDFALGVVRAADDEVEGPDRGRGFAEEVELRRELVVGAVSHADILPVGGPST